MREKTREAFVPLVFQTGDAVQIDWGQVYLTHTVTGKKADVGTLLLEEQSRLFPLLGYPYDPAKRAGVRVTPFSTARYDTNSYYVPVKFCGSIVSIKTLPERVEFYAHGNLIAAHNRQQNIYQMAHYLPLPEQKGRAIFQAKPVRDHVPEYFLDWLTRQTLQPKEPVHCRSEARKSG